MVQCRVCPKGLYMRKSPYLLVFIILSLLFSGSSVWAAAKNNADSSNAGSQPVFWYEGGIRKQAWMALDEMVVIPKKKGLSRAEKETLVYQVHPEAVVTGESGSIIYLKVPGSVNRDQIIRRVSVLREEENVALTSPLFYGAEARDPASRMILTSEIIVQYLKDYAEKSIRETELEFGLSRIKKFSYAPNTFLYRVRDPLISLDLANALYHTAQVIFAYPNWFRSRAVRAIPDDTLFGDQWHLENTGQGGGLIGEDVNVVTVWDTFRGSPSEVIAIVDDGLEVAHVDLVDNILPGMSWDFVEGDSNPTAGTHGTRVAGIAAGRGFNAQGITGVAPMAGLVGHRLLGLGGGPFVLDAHEADALSRNSHIIDIYSNSWGPFDDGRRLEGPGPLTESAIEDGVTTGRGGLGTIYVWAGGNGGLSGDNSNYDGYTNSRFTIAVAASTNLGDKAPYSESGANILVAEPSSGGTLDIVTTDRDNSYITSFGGTSSSTPLVSGIIALMLEANPNLTWRDVQHILITTAAQIDPQDSDWTVNGAGLPINHKYGFGRIDALAAVNTALTWTQVDPENSIPVETISKPNLPIPDNNTVGVSDTIFISGSITVESVDIFFTAADHLRWGDLEITLISPEGTESILAEDHSTSINSSTYDGWRFGSVRHFGEASEGTWTLRIRDLRPSFTGTFEQWTLRLHGTSNQGLGGGGGGCFIKTSGLSGSRVRP